MARVTVEDCLNQVNSRFALVHLAVRRVLQMRKGYPVFVDAPKNKEIVRALREVAAGYVTTQNIRELEAGPDSPAELELEADVEEQVVMEDPAAETEDAAGVETTESEVDAALDDVGMDEIQSETDAESDADDVIDEDTD